MILKLLLSIFLLDYVATAGEPCKRHDDSDGTCTPFRLCPAIYNLDQRAKADPKLKALIKKNVCKTSARQVLVCCPNRENYCVNPNADEGTCTILSACSKLNEMWTDKSQQTPVTIEYLEKSQCDYKNQKVYVCCTPEDNTVDAPVTMLPPETTTTALEDEYDAETRRIVEKLKSPLIPRPPECGTLLDDFIFGGGEAGFREFLWTVSLKYKNIEKNSFKYNCGGSLINERYVLTAAHCVVGLASGTSLVDVRIGEHNFDTDPDCDPDEPTDCLPAPIDMNVAEVIVHPEYNLTIKDRNSDIALLRLAEKVVFTESLKPVCLPLDPSLWKSDFSGKVFQVTGWGLTENRTKSKVKRKVRLPVVSQETCKESFKTHGRTIVDSQICAGGELGKDSCGGDSGGPLMLKNTHKPVADWYIAGIVSYGLRFCGTEGIPGVYTRVSSFLEWIVDNLKP